eukprot:2259305-Lingulodinium_polyedra.AAC.1
MSRLGFISARTRTGHPAWYLSCTARATAWLRVSGSLYCLWTYGLSVATAGMHGRCCLAWLPFTFAATVKYWASHHVA